MTTAIIITFCSLLLIAYLFTITATNTKIPSVILLLLLGWGIKQITLFLEFQLPDFSPTLPVLATIGLILIVLEGSMELELNRSNVGLLLKSFIGALVPMAGLSILFAYFFQYLGGYSLRVSLINTIPLFIISSAIAIPSIRHLKPSSRDFLIYESSLSDILGVLFFNFVVINETIDLSSFSDFSLKLVLILVISIVATVGLLVLLKKIKHHIKFVPIILMVILIYSVLKVFHLPALIFILLFGLSLSNLEKFWRSKWVSRFKSDGLTIEIQKFKELTIEGAFLIRALFFILFGYLLETPEILNTDTLQWAALIVLSIFTLRIIQLKLSKLPLDPLLFVAPRGLITILLFITIKPVNQIFYINNSLILQVILLSTLVMTFGLIFTKEEKES